MKAAVLTEHGAPLAIETLPDPIPGPGEVVVDIAATRVLAYMGEVLSGERNYLFETPIVPGPGGIGRVQALGPDATRLKVGDWVFCDSTLRSRDDAMAPDIVLQGLTAASEAAMPLQRHFRDGSFAERMRLPLENATPIGDLTPEELSRWAPFGTLLVPYGGLLAGGLKAGETVLINGATGAFGGAGVAVALGMGAGCVIATGRNRTALDELARRFGDRVVTVAVGGTDEAADRGAILAAAQGPIDCMLDLLPPMAVPGQVQAALPTVRPYGRVVLMGGLLSDVAMPYSWLMRNGITVRGQWMYPRDAVGRLVRLVRAGLIDLDGYTLTRFGLDEANEAVAHAAANTGPFQMTVIYP